MLHFASVSYPRCNGQVERANVEVLKGLKTKAFNKLDNRGKNWIEHLPSVLWFLRTTPTRPNGETPFFLVYGAEAVLPTELKHGSPRVLAYDEDTQAELRIDYINVWRKCAVGRHYGLLGTSNGCAGTTAVMCDPGNYSRET